MVSVYVTHDGETFSARYSQKSGTVTDARTLHLTDASEEVRIWFRPVTVSLLTSQNFESESVHCNFDTELVNWCAESSGTSFNGVVSDADAILALLKEKNKSLSETYHLIYVLEHRVKFVLVHREKIISQLHMGEPELQYGLEPLLRRCEAWYNTNDIIVKAENTFFIGTYPESVNDLSFEPVFSEVETPFLVAAGIPLVQKKNYLIHSSPLNRALRSLRGGLLGASIALFIISLLGFGSISILKRNVTNAIETSSYSIELSKQNKSRIDSLSTEAARRRLIMTKMRNHRRWSDILSDFSKVEHEGITLGRLGSRETEGKLELAFDGEGKSEQAVTNYISSLKESERFIDIQLTQMDRSKNARYRFRVQCIVQL